MKNLEQTLYMQNFDVSFSKVFSPGGQIYFQTKAMLFLVK